MFEFVYSVSWYIFCTTQQTNESNFVFSIRMNLNDEQIRLLVTMVLEWTPSKLLIINGHYIHSHYQGLDPLPQTAYSDIPNGKQSL